jgi:hypothetical protein
MEVEYPPAVNTAVPTVAFYASGRFDDWTKETFKRIHGLEHKSTLSKKCSFLVLGNSNLGPDKIRKAISWKIPIVGVAFINAWVTAADTSLLLVNIRDHIISAGEHFPDQYNTRFAL